MEFAGFFDDRPESRTKQETVENPPRAGDLSQLVEMAHSGEVDTIYITFPMRAEERIRDYLSKLSDTTASVYIVPDFFVFQMLHARWNQINGLPVVSLFETPISGIDGVLKRGFDLVVVSLALLALALPMAVVALLGSSRHRDLCFSAKALRSLGRGNLRVEISQHALLR